MSEFQKIGDILNNSSLIKKWQPPEKEERYCPYCNSLMIAKKEAYKHWEGTNTFGERYRYKYFCKNNCEEKLKQRDEYKIRYQKARKVWEEIGLSRECVGWNLNKMTCENIEYLREYANKFNRFSKALILKGSKGTGKTLSSECIVKKLTHNGFKCRITNMTEINIEMNQALRKDKYKEYLKELLRLDLLVIDDFGREQYNTEKSLENVFQFFNTLTKERKPYIVSINPEMLAIIAQKPQLDACLDRFKKSSSVKILEFKNKSFRN